MILALLLVVSILIHGFGAISLKSTFWNLQPQNIDEAPARLWDWRQPQFLSGWLPAPLPGEFPAWPSGQSLALDQPGAIPQLWDGWSSVESGTRRAMAPRARVVFALDVLRPLHLRLELRPYLLPGKLEAQRMNARLNGQPVGTWHLTDAKQLALIDIPLPPTVQRKRNVVEFEFPDARSPESLVHASDPRRLGAAMKSLTLLPGDAAESRSLPEHQ